MGLLDPPDDWELLRSQVEAVRNVVGRVLGSLNNVLKHNAPPADLRQQATNAIPAVKRLLAMLEKHAGASTPPSSTPTRARFQG